MRLRVSLLALGAICCLFSGCGCSKEEKAGPGVLPRMQDAAYTNQLVQVQDRKKAVAAQIAALQAQIDRLGANAKKDSPEYVDLTNQLAQCKLQSERLRKEALMTIRARVVKDAASKGNLNK